MKTKKNRRKRMLKRYTVLMALLVAGMMVISACAPAAAPVAEEATPVVEEAAPAPTAETAPTAEAVKLSGDILVDGSSTVYPITVAVAEEFIKTQPDVRPSVGLSGTGGGFKKFCPGESDISDASRRIKDEEKAICDENKIQYTEFLVAMDGLTVMVNPENDWLQSLTVDQLGKILGANSTIVKWSDIDPTFPAEDIKFFIPDPDSGTRDYMIEVIAKATGDEDLRQDENTSFNSDDNVLLDGIANDKYALGFFGFAYYVNNAEVVKAVAIVNKDGNAVLPSNETVQDGTYNPLSRPLFIYTNNETLKSKPQVAEFVKFYFSEAGAPAIMAEVGYSMPPAGTYEDNMAKLEAVIGK
jgi:phosphate transport system substrate-binding protein